SAALDCACVAPIGNNSAAVSAIAKSPVERRSVKACSSGKWANIMVQIKVSPDDATVQAKIRDNSCGEFEGPGSAAARSSQDLRISESELEMAEYVVEFGKDGGSRETDGRLDAPAFHRNHQAICGVLERYLTGKSGDAVEIGSGTGQHVVEFARRFPLLTWWPSDLNENHLKSIEAWRMHSGLSNVRPPRPIDASDPAWGDAVKR